MAKVKGPREHYNIELSKLEIEGLHLLLGQGVSMALLQTLNLLELYDRLAEMDLAVPPLEISPAQIYIRGACGNKD